MQEALDSSLENDTRLTEEAIVDRIFQAVIEQRLPPGTKLSESALCKAFGVGRMRIRRSLLLLSSRQVVDLQSNRGAYIASPTAQQAREVFEARCSIEPSVIRLAVQRATPVDIDKLAAHLEREHRALEEGNRKDAIRLSGEFHVRLAETAGNAIMTRMVRELVTRTSLILALYGSPETASCDDDHHDKLLNAMRVRNEEAAADTMTVHLNEIAVQLDLSAERPNGLDIVSILKT